MLVFSLFHLDLGPILQFWDFTNGKCQY